ncbi:hypothetical protein PRZ48_004570 [Zasmidium cellare]|uniref:Uncharacterized protein n=1 Tax=Zasmidium cellare TaxID=395010 RepID=A0ABR0ER84_ZASCE|nr:hypothetical protein PRZ48_004570 [Zasmidium cellare]
MDGRCDRRSASPSRTPRNRDDDRSYRDREEPLPRIATWEEYESARELLYQWSDNLTLDDSAHTRYWEAQNNRLLSHLEEAKRYLPNRHRPRNDPALPTAPVRSHEEREMLRKQILQCWDLSDYYEKNNDREQVAYWQAARRQLYVRYKAAKVTLPPLDVPIPPAPIPPAPISNWTEYNSVRDNALKLCTAAVSLKDLDAPAAVSYFKRARRRYERLEAAERHLPPRNPAEIKAESIL